MSTTFFTADIHFGHRGVIDYAGRQFRDIDHMDASIIERWNATVGDKDDVYIVGDFALCSRARALDVGMDCWGYAPVSYQRLKERMAAKDWKPVDHHGANR